MTVPVVGGLPPGAHGTGYRLTRMYALEQSYRIRANEQHASAGSVGRQFQISWDWRVSGARTFDVIVTLTALPSDEQPDEGRVSLVATFEAGPEQQTVSFGDFVRFNAPAMLIPFAREAVAQITARGPYGSFILVPFNVVGVMSSFDPMLATGMQQLRADPSLRLTFPLVDPAAFLAPG